MKGHKKNKRGITVVEALVATSIAAVFLVSATFTIVRFINTSHTVSENTQALYLAEEGQELVRFIRDNDWANISSLSLGTNHYIDIQTSDVVTTATPETLGIFTRSFSLQNVERDGDDDIVVSGTEDSDSKYVTVTISWGSPLKTTSLTSILTNLNP